jgi:tRNA A37 threonylcarbamoyltransferase TsaD
MNETQVRAGQMRPVLGIEASCDETAAAVLDAELAPCFTELATERSAPHIRSAP